MQTIPGYSTEVFDTFEPGVYNSAELQFVVDHLGEHPDDAFAEAIPQGVSRAQVEPLLQKVWQLDRRNQPWCGSQRIIEAISAYQAWIGRAEAMRRRGGPKIPSMFSWDGAGGGHRYGPGSDSGVIRTEIRADGTRRRFTVTLTKSPDELANESDAFLPDFATPKPIPKALEEDATRGLIICPICAHTANYAPDGGRSAYNLARAQMKRHLQHAKTERSLHRSLLTIVFGTRDA